MLPKNPDYPLDVHYCKWCKVPPEYCEFLSEDIEKCKEWLLKQRKPHLMAIYKELYGEIKVKEDAAEGEGDNSEPEEEEKKEKKPKKVKKDKNKKKVFDVSSSLLIEHM